MPIRDIEYRVTEDSMEHVQGKYAGIMGEHMATQIKFCLSDPLINLLQQSNARYRFEGENMHGEYLASENFMYVGDSGYVTLELNKNWTKQGLSSVRVIVFLIGEDNQEDLIFYSKPARVNVEVRSQDVVKKEGEIEAGIGVLVENMNQALSKSERVTQEALTATALAYRNFSRLCIPQHLSPTFRLFMKNRFHKLLYHFPDGLKK